MDEKSWYVHWFTQLEFMTSLIHLNSRSPRNLKVTHNLYRSKYPNNVQHQPNHMIELSIYHQSLIYWCVRNARRK
jgi:hypothetical protein